MFGNCAGIDAGGVGVVVLRRERPLVKQDKTVRQSLKIPRGWPSEFSSDNYRVRAYIEHTFRRLFVVLESYDTLGVRIVYASTPRPGQSFTANFSTPKGVPQIYVRSTYVCCIAIKNKASTLEREWREKQ